MTHQEQYDALRVMGSQAPDGMVAIERFIIILGEKKKWGVGSTELDAMIDGVPAGILPDLLMFLVVEKFIFMTENDIMVLEPLNDFVSSMLVPHEYPRMR